MALSDEESESILQLCQALVMQKAREYKALLEFFHEIGFDPTQLNVPRNNEDGFSSTTAQSAKGDPTGFRSDPPWV